MNEPTDFDELRKEFYRTSAEFWGGLNLMMAELRIHLIPAIQDCVETLLPVMEALQEAVSIAYREAGQPYGDNHDGMLRWLREVSRAEALKSEAESIYRRHELLAGFRRKIENQ